MGLEPTTPCLQSKNAHALYLPTSDATCEITSLYFAPVTSLLQPFAAWPRPGLRRF
jgi:hypothetical protein